MALEEKIKWKCEKCKAKEAFDVPYYFETTQDPHYLQQLLSGELFEHRCSKCGEKGANGASLIAANISKGYLCALGRSVIDETKESVMQLIKNNHLESRLTMTGEEMREKVMMAEQGLSDVAVELVKYFVRRIERLQLRPTEKMTLTECRKDEQSGRRELTFDIPGGRVEKRYTMSDELYMKLRPLTMLSELKTGAFERVDSRWIERKMTALKDKYEEYYIQEAEKTDRERNN